MVRSLHILEKKRREWKWPPLSETANETDLISEDDAEENGNLNEIWKAVKSVQDNTKQLIDTTVG